MTLPEPTESRREFMRASGRCLGLGGLAALVIAGEAKRRRLGEQCVKIAGCSECVQFHGCTQPKAEQFRQANSA